MPDTDVFNTDSLCVSYGGVRALVDVSIRLGHGELVGLIGANGAGKTTFIDAVTGFAAATGRVFVDGVDVSRKRAHQRFASGLRRTWQGGDLFEDLPVRDNVKVAAEGLGFGGGGRSGRSNGVTRSVDQVLEQLDLFDVASRVPAELPQGKRKLVGVARALVGSPSVICLDEPAAGLSSSEGQLLGEVFRSVAHSGVGLLLVEHDVDLVLGICDRVYVLERGGLLAEGAPDAIRSDQGVIEAYLGTAISEESEAVGNAP
jgi:branched-chain amino acid transport system ATP-binding protein